MNKLAFRYVEETKKLVENLGKGFLELGERLYKIRVDELWSSNYDSYEEFLEDIKMSPSNASKLVSIHQFYVLEHGVTEEKLAQSSWSTLYTAIPMLKGKNKKEISDTITELGLKRRVDAEQTVREMKAGEHNHQWQELHIRQCKICGKKEKIYDANL